MRPFCSALFFGASIRRFPDRGRRAFLLGFLLVSGGVPLTAPAQGVVVVRPGARPAWRDLGTAVVSYGVNRDAITVYDEQVFRALKFKVWDAPLDMLEAEVLYANGARDRVPIRQVVQRGQESSPLNLRGGPRRIRKVFFTYRFVPGFTGRRAKITLFGIR